MTAITWRRVRAGEYESEAGRVWHIRFKGGDAWVFRVNGSDRETRRSYLADAKATCERAWRRAQEGDTP